MGSIFIQDTSTQGTGGLPTYSITYPTKTYPIIKMRTDCGIYNSANNEIKIFTNGIDAFTVDSSQKVICNGSLITNLDWNKIDGKPNFFSGNYNDLTNKPGLFDGNYNSLTNKPDFSIYATNANLGNYLTTASASTTYLTITNASTTYANANNLLTQFTTRKLNVVDASLPSSVQERNLNLIGSSAVMRIFRFGSDPAFELIWNPIAPTSSSDYTYYWDFFISSLNGSFNIRDRVIALNRLVILANGNVGIGNNTPSYRLDVSGNINSSGLFVSGNNINTIYATISSLSSY